MNTDEIADQIFMRIGCFESAFALNQGKRNSGIRLQFETVDYIRSLLYIPHERRYVDLPMSMNKRGIAANKKATRCARRVERMIHDHRGKNGIGKLQARIR